MKRNLFLLFLCLTGALSGYAQQQPNYSSAHIRLLLHKANTVGNVLYIAAHPDDENTRLISWLANDQYVNTAYLSLTRGDGGQNLIGTEKGALMGLLRTQELMEARRVDGGKQFFTRAVDFGYSKTPEETFEFWDKEQVLADVVWTIRKFRPDIIITRFPPTSRAGHGHHTASAILAAEAFDLAGNPEAFPEQLKHVKTHQPKSLYHNTSTWWYKDLPEQAKDNPNYATADIGTYSPLLGMSYNEIASESRSRHQSQGFGSARARGSQTEYLEWVKGEKVGATLFEKGDITWNRLEGGKAIDKAFATLLSNFNDLAPWESIPALLNIRKQIKAMPANDFKADKLAEIDQLLLACSGTWLEVRANSDRYAYGAEMPLAVLAINRSPYNVTLKKVEVGSKTTVTVPVQLTENNLITVNDTITAPNRDTHPYWLVKTYDGMFEVSDQLEIGMPENKAAVMATYQLDFGGEIITVERPVVYQWVERASGEHYSPVAITPKVTAHIDGQVLIFNDSKPRLIDVVVTAHADDQRGSISFTAPEGWQQKDAQNFYLAQKGQTQRITMQLTPPEKSSKGTLGIRIKLEDGTIETKDLIEIAYGHIQKQTLLPEAQSQVIRMDIKTKGKRIGYIEGAGDDVPASLEKIGYQVELLDPAHLDTIKLNRFDCIIVGIRAFNTQEALAFQNIHLKRYVEYGGNVIVQYNTNRGLVTDAIGPYPFQLSRERVTDETAVPTILAPKHPIFNTPNTITTADFESWVQERGLYFADEWNEAYTPLIAWNDPGAEPSKGAILAAEYGKGTFIFTGISFFRQLPAGVPGAYRLFANMIAYGQQ